MEFFNRILNAARANVNSWFIQTEDPEKALEQAIEELQDQIIQLRQVVAQAVAMQKRTERQCRQARNKAYDWQQQAELALRQGNEILACQALAQRRSLLETVRHLEPQIISQRNLITQLKHDLKTLESQLSDVRVKRDLYLVRARSAQASQRIHEMLGKLDTSKVGHIFEQMEQRVADLEAQSAAIVQINQDSLEERFAILEQEDVEEELSRMRSRLRAEGTIDEQ